jgi:hypothetical protein
MPTFTALSAVMVAITACALGGCGSRGASSRR